MTPNDPIPEAHPATDYINNTFAGGGRLTFEDISRLISNACLSYYSRRLAESGGDASRVASHICNLFATSYMDVHTQAGPWGTKHVDDITSIIREHTAREVEKATQKQCEELRVSLQLKASEAFIANQTCDDLRTRAEKAEADLTIQKLRADKAETLLAVFVSKLPEDQRANEVAAEHQALAEQLVQRLEKAETEVAELRGYLERAGWGPCNAPACNCNGWHQVRATQRELELESELSALKQKAITELRNQQDIDQQQ